MGGYVKKSDLYREYARVIDYDAPTGLFRWKKNVGRYSKIGSFAGTVNADGYVHIKINQQILKAHRLAWLFYFGEFPTDEIDHINRNKQDNRIANLRLTSRSKNELNKGLRKDNKSGCAGVTWRPDTNKWLARISYKGERFYIGMFAKKSDAILHRTKAYNAMMEA